MRIIVAVALLLGSALTARAQMTYPIRELENSLRASREFDQRARREAVEQKRTEREQQRKAAIQENAAPVTPKPVDMTPTMAPNAPPPPPIKPLTR